MMMLNEIIKSCGNASIAEAAVRSIGVSFTQEILAAAKERGMPLGAFDSATVRQFDRHAPPDVRQALMRTIRRTDQPILAGLRFILDHVLQQHDDRTLRGPYGPQRSHQTAPMSCCFL